MRLTLRPEGLEKVKKVLQIGSDAQLASQMDINHSQLHRVTAGKCEPGARFIAGALAAFGSEHFFDIFHLVADEEGVA